MPRNARRNTLTLGFVLLASVGAIVTLVAWWGGDDRAAESLDPGPETQGPSSEERESTRAPVDRGASSGDGGGPATLVTRRLLCLRAADLQPVAGVRLYAGVESVAGPTRADGVLEVSDLQTFLVTVWGKGWLPQEFAAAALPEQVLLEGADATLEVRLQNMLPGHRVHRNLIQPHTRLARGGGPWGPAFESWGADLYGAEGIPGNTYDVYFWVSRDGAEPRPFSQAGVVIPRGETVVLNLDLSVPPEPEEDH